MASLPPANSGRITLKDGSELSYQGKVNFNTSGTDGLKNPRVVVDAYDVNSGELIYGEAGGASETFTLGGGMSKWVERGGGPAHCAATLFYFKVEGTNREWHGRGQQEYV